MTGAKVLSQPYRAGNLDTRGAAGADRANKASDLAVGLLPDFRTGGEIVRQAVVEIIPLVGVKDAIWFALAQLVGEPPRNVLIIVRIAVRQRRHLDQLRAGKP